MGVEEAMRRRAFAPAPYFRVDGTGRVSSAPRLCARKRLIGLCCSRVSAETVTSVAVYMHSLHFISCMFCVSGSAGLKVLVAIVLYCERVKERYRLRCEHRGRCSVSHGGC